MLLTMTTENLQEFAEMVAEQTAQKTTEMILEKLKTEKPLDLDRELSRKDLAEHFKCSIATINRMLKAREIPHVWRGAKRVVKLRDILNEK